MILITRLISLTVAVWHLSQDADTSQYKQRLTKRTKTKLWDGFFQQIHKQLKFLLKGSFSLVFV